MRFRILGPVEVQVDGGWSSISAPKLRTVLAVLLLRAGEIVSTDQLVGEVWPDDAPARAINLISGYVHKLRRLIGDPEGRVVVTHAPGYQLLAKAGDIDAWRFSRLAADGREALFTGDSQGAAALLSEALTLWQGSRALPDVPASGLVSAEASRLEEARVEALELRIQADLGCGRQGQVVAELRRLLADHPMREGMWALLMRALYGSGRQAEALEAYAQAREVIAEELRSLRLTILRNENRRGGLPLRAHSGTVSEVGSGRRSRRGAAAVRGIGAADPGHRLCADGDPAGVPGCAAARRHTRLHRPG
jgi:DNA-binding SARP family transcriptional activator